MVISAVSRAATKIAAKTAAESRGTKKIVVSARMKTKLKKMKAYKARQEKENRVVADKKFRTEHAAEIRAFGIVKARKLEARDQRLAEGRSVVPLDSIFGRNLKAVKTGSPEHHARLKHSFKELDRLKATRNLGPTSTSGLKKDPMGGKGRKSLAVGQSYNEPNYVYGQSFDIVKRYMRYGGGRTHSYGGKIQDMPGFDIKKWRSDRIYGSDRWTDPFVVDVSSTYHPNDMFSHVVKVKQRKKRFWHVGDRIKKTATAEAIADANHPPSKQRWTFPDGSRIQTYYDKIEDVSPMSAKAGLLSVGVAGTGIAISGALPLLFGAKGKKKKAKKKRVKR